MIDYESEKNVELKKHLRSKLYTNIQGDGVFINGQLVKFCLRNIIDKVSLFIPEEFIDMPEEIKLMKYPSISRPQKIVTSLDNSVNFAFSYVEQRMSVDQIDSLTDQMKNLIRKFNPAAVFYQKSLEYRANESPICMFDFKSYSIDEQMYNMTCFTSLNSGTLHGTFTCLDKDSKNWKDIAWEAFKTIREVT